MASVSEKELELRRRLKRDFPFYAKKCLTIRTKEGKLEPFEINPAQMMLHKKAEEQRERTGKVRLLVLKARQPGISTYVGGRYFWRCTHGKGRRVFILTHKDDATTNLFDMAKRYYDNCPDLLKPTVKAANAKELDFLHLDSGYRVGTAKAQGVGRSDTIQFFHGSEVAWWSNASEHVTGALQAVPNAPGTEVFLESTANGIGGLFYAMCQAAMAGIGEYEVFFLPWFNHHEYRTEAPADWMPPQQFQEMEEVYALHRDQTYWAYLKNQELAIADEYPDDKICWKFQQEYPSNEEEAFQAGGEERFIQSNVVVRARKTEVSDQDHAQLIIGCDFARGERDQNYFISRKGRKLGKHVHLKFQSSDTTDIAARLIRVIEDHKPAMCFLDTGGEGASVYDICCSRGYGHVLTLVNFGSGAEDNARYRNKRSEMYGRLKEWLSDKGGAEMVDDSSLHSQICASSYKYNANQQIVLEDKDKIRARLGFSPDGGDAAALTFAEEVGGAADPWSRSLDYSHMPQPV